MNNNELMHYGVPGMKWGVRRVSRKEARSYQRRLNKLDQEAVNHIGRSIIAERKAMKTGIKGVKYMQKHPNNATPRQIAKLSKIHDKMKKEMATQKSEIKTAKDIESRTWKVIGEALEKGYSVDNEHILRNSQRGKTTALTMLLGGFGSATVQAISSADYGRFTDGKTPYSIWGNKYKVR